MARFFYSLFLLFCFSATLAQTRDTQGALRQNAFSMHNILRSSSPYKNLQWRNVSPDIISGRCTEVLGVPGNRNIIYASFASGGLWKTSNAGESWDPLSDQIGTLSIGSFDVAPSNPNIIYVGTGEANIFRASLPGMGAYKSTDGGKTWKHIGLTNTGTIARVRIHPTNPDIVYVAAGGNEWSYNNDRGLFKTTDGGKTWKKILGNDEKTGVIDVAIDPSNPDNILVSTWNRIRRRWSDPVPEDGDYIYKTTDGGNSWKKVTQGLPETKFTGRIGLSISKSNPNIVYAYVDNHTPKRDPKPGELDPYGRPIQVIPYGVQVYRSEDKGESWKKVSTEDEKLERFAGTYGWVFGQIRVDPNNPDVVYIMGVPIAKSLDGGKTFNPIRPNQKTSDPLHSDHHALWIDPTNSNYVVNGNDGGVVLSYDGGTTWKNFFTKIPTTQFYNVTYDMSTPFNILGSVQDEGSFMASSKNTFGKKSEGIKPWQDAPGGEGTIIAVDPKDPNIVYASTFYGRLQRSDLRMPRVPWGKKENPDSIRSKDIFPTKADNEEVHRGEWLAYTMLSPHDNKTIYHGFQYLFESKDGGNTWKRISEDLTYNDKSRMGRTPYAINHQAITAIDESPLQKGLLYVGTDDGRVWVRQSESESFKLIMKNIPQNAHVSRLVASKYNKNRVYLTLSNRREDDDRPYVYVSNDNGTTWKSIAGNLPASPVNVIREDLQNPSVLYCGTDMGIYVSTNGGTTWKSLQSNLPSTVSVQDLFIHPRDKQLVIATYGRGVFVMEDISTIK
ncbi:MAG: WD40/YVTN/BNR-like repeat-containing protein [Chitinophagaceae bacterium]